jgi:hypothetical protein
MRTYLTDCRMWGTTAFAVWVAFLVWEHFVERYGIVWHAMDLIGAVGEGQNPWGLAKAARDFCLVPGLKAALVATLVAWPLQAAAVAMGFRLRRAPSPALVADYDDKPDPCPAV